MKLDRFLFSPVDPLHVGICRLVFAGVLILVFRPRGGAPDAILSSTAWWVATAGMWTMFCVGVAPRVAGLLLAALLYPLIFEPGLHASRQILLFALVVFSMTRCDERFSLWRPGAGSSSGGPAWPIRLMQLQLSVLYGINAMAKTTPQFLNGDALTAMSLLPNFRMNMSDGYLHLGLLDMPVALAGTGVVLTEYALAIGVWIPRLRWPVAVLGVAFHIALTRVVQIGMLHVACLFLYVTFLVPFFEDRERETRALPNQA